MKLTEKFWRRYSSFMMGLFFTGAIANIFNTYFFYGHETEAIQTLSNNFFALVFVDASLVYLHYWFVKTNRRPKSWVQWSLTIANVIAVSLNILLAIQVYDLINWLWQN